MKSNIDGPKDNITPKSITDAVRQVKKNNSYPLNRLPDGNIAMPAQPPDKALDELYNPEITDLERDEYQGNNRPVIYLDDAKEALQVLLDNRAVEELERKYDIQLDMDTPQRYQDGFSDAVDQMETAKKLRITELKGRH